MTLLVSDLEQMARRAREASWATGLLIELEVTPEGLLIRCGTRARRSVERVIAWTAIGSAVWPQPLFGRELRDAVVQLRGELG